MKNTLLAAVAVVIMCGATVAYAQQTPDLTLDMREVSPAGAAAAQPRVQAWQAEAEQALAEAEAEAQNAPEHSPVAKAIAALKIRVSALEAANQQLTAARRGVRGIKWKVVTQAVSPMYTEVCALKDALQNLRVSVAANKVGLKKVARVAGEGLERAKLAQASTDRVKDTLIVLRTEISAVRSIAAAALSDANLPPPQTVFATASAFTGWSSEAIVGMGIGLEAPFAKLDARLSTNIGSYREVDALVALRTSTAASWLNPYAGLHYVGVFKDSFDSGITDNRVGLGLGNGFKVNDVLAIDARLSGDVGGETTVLAATAAMEVRF